MTVALELCAGHGLRAPGRLRPRKCSRSSRRSIARATTRRWSTHRSPPRMPARTSPSSSSCARDSTKRRTSSCRIACRKPARTSCTAWWATRRTPNSRWSFGASRGNSSLLPSGHGQLPPQDSPRLHRLRAFHLRRRDRPGRSRALPAAHEPHPNAEAVLPDPVTVRIARRDHLQACPRSRQRARRQAGPRHRQDERAGRPAGDRSPFTARRARA